MNDFAKNFREILKQRGLTQTQAAELLGISQSLVSAYILGRHAPLRRTAEHIAKKLSVPVDALLQNSTEFSKYVKEARASAIRLPKPKQPQEEAMLELKRRWKQKPMERDQILIALRVLFPQSHEKVVEWLKRQ